MWPDLMRIVRYNTLASALDVLTAMITPALLISATGTYILATANRLGRVVDRMRLISDRVEVLFQNEHAGLREERIEDYRAQMIRLQKRLRLLQRALIILYMAALTFILCSVAIGTTAAVSLKLYWIPVMLGILGAFMLLVASVLLILEARLAVRDLELETEFLGKVAKHHAGQ
jgi:hypothetical protein